MVLIEITINFQNVWMPEVGSEDEMCHWLC